MKNPTAQLILRTLRTKSDPQRAKASGWFFKTGKGQYGYGDKFLGIRVPVQRTIAHKYQTLPLVEIQKLLRSPYHEARFTALEILVIQYEHGTKTTKQQICNFYLTHTNQINNWDLVDTSAPYILGDFLLQHPKQEKILYQLARSHNLWERRIAIVATGKFISQGYLAPTLTIATLLLKDDHDLIHKAVGWMLREVGKKDIRILRGYLRKFAWQLPRTTLRYSIERLPKTERVKWMQTKAKN